MRSKEASKGIDLARSPVQLFGDQITVWRVVFAKLEFVDALLNFPFSRQRRRITLNAGRGSGNAPRRSFASSFMMICESGPGFFSNRPLAAPAFWRYGVDPLHRIECGERQ